MSSPKPIPSRAALNALRGLVIGTSCSVALLAEERRRRTKLARTAIENARKIHTLKTRRRPSKHAAHVNAQSESTFTQSSPLQASQQKSVLVKDRKKRDGQTVPSGRQALQNESLSSTHINQLQASRKQDIRQNGRNELSEARSSSLSVRFPEFKSGVSHQRQRQTPFVRTLLLSRSLRDSAPRDLSSALQTEFPSTQSDPERLIAKARRLTTSVGGDFERIGGSNINSLKHEIEEWLTTEDLPKAEAFSCLRAAGFFLNSLFDGLSRLPESYDADSTRLDLAVRIIVKTSKSHFKVNREFKGTVLEWLEYMASIHSDKLGLAIDAVAPEWYHYNRLFEVLLHKRSVADDQAGIRGLLRAFASIKSSKFKLNGHFVYRLFHHYVTSETSLSKSRGVVEYQQLRNAGLLEDYNLSLKDKMKLSKLMISAATEETSETFRIAENEQLRNLRARFLEALEANFGLDSIPNGLIIAAMAKDLENTLGPDGIGLNKKLTPLVNSCAARLKPRDLEALLRYFIEGYALKLRGAWVYPIIEAYTKHDREEKGEALLSWLRFCARNKFRLQANVMQKVYNRCEKHFLMSRAELVRTGKELRMHDARILDFDQEPSPAVEALPEETKEIEPLLEPWEQHYVHNSRVLLDSVRGSAKYKDNFQSILKHIESGDWEAAWKAFEETPAGALSIPCLRLAVLARLKIDDSTDTAYHFLHQLQTEGVDVSQALTPVLMAQLADGQTPLRIIERTLRRNQQIEDIVFNLAAQRASANGQFQQSVEICHLAAINNGLGDLLYNEFNFSNLVFALTALQHYPELDALLSAFTSTQYPYVSGETCKRALKLAMKSMTRRAIMARSPQRRQHCEPVVSQLDFALTHGKNMRTLSQQSEEWRTATGANKTSDRLSINEDADAFNPAIELRTLSATNNSLLSGSKPQRPIADDLSLIYISRSMVGAGGSIRGPPERHLLLDLRRRVNGLHTNLSEALRSAGASASSSQKAPVVELPGENIRKHHQEDEQRRISSNDIYNTAIHSADKEAGYSPETTVGESKMDKRKPAPEDTNRFSRPAPHKTANTEKEIPRTPSIDNTRFFEHSARPFDVSPVPNTDQVLKPSRFYVPPELIIPALGHASRFSNYRPMHSRRRLTIGEAKFSTTARLYKRHTKRSSQQLKKSDKDVHESAIQIQKVRIDEKQAATVTVASERRDTTPSTQNLDDNNHSQQQDGNKTDKGSDGFELLNSLIAAGLKESKENHQFTVDAWKSHVDSAKIQAQDAVRRLQAVTARARRSKSVESLKQNQESTQHSTTAITSKGNSFASILNSDEHFWDDWSDQQQKLSLSRKSLANRRSQPQTTKSLSDLKSAKHQRPVDPFELMLQQRRDSAPGTKSSIIKVQGKKTSNQKQSKKKPSISPALTTTTTTATTLLDDPFAVMQTLRRDSKSPAQNKQPAKSSKTKQASSPSSVEPAIDDDPFAIMQTMRRDAGGPKATTSIGKKRKSRRAKSRKKRKKKAESTSDVDSPMNDSFDIMRSLRRG